MVLVTLHTASSSQSWTVTASSQQVLVSECIFAISCLRPTRYGRHRAFQLVLNRSEEVNVQVLSPKSTPSGHCLSKVLHPNPKEQPQVNQLSGGFSSEQTPSAFAMPWQGLPTQAGMSAKKGTRCDGSVLKALAAVPNSGSIKHSISAASCTLSAPVVEQFNSDSPWQPWSSL